MTRRGIQAAGVVVLGIAVAGVAGRGVAAQAAQLAGTGQKVAAQIIPADQEDEFIKGALPAKTPGLVPPTLARQSNPKYTADTLRAKLEGDVKLEAVVGVDGRVEKARVKEPLDPVLDAQALRALDDWKFEPGTLDGRPVRVLVEVQMTFRVR